MKEWIDKFQKFVLDFKFDNWVLIILIAFAAIFIGALILACFTGEVNALRRAAKKMAKANGAFTADQAAKKLPFKAKRSYFAARKQNLNPSDSMAQLEVSAPYSGSFLRRFPLFTVAVTLLFTIGIFALGNYFNFVGKIKPIMTYAYMLSMIGLGLVCSSIAGIVSLALGKCAHKHYGNMVLQCDNLFSEGDDNEFFKEEDEGGAVQEEFDLSVLMQQEDPLPLIEEHNKEEVAPEESSAIKEDEERTILAEDENAQIKAAATIEMTPQEATEQLINDILLLSSDNVSMKDIKYFALKLQEERAKEQNREGDNRTQLNDALEHLVQVMHIVTKQI